jgi:UDP-glucose 4-epimerase
MNVYGPGQDYQGAYVAVMMKMLDRIDQGFPPIVYGDGNQRYDFIYVGDVARANILAMQGDVSGKCYNVGRGVGTSVKELAELLLRLTGSVLPVEYQSAGQTFVTNRVGATEAAGHDLGFHWEVGLEEGMRRLIAWRQADQAAVRDRRARDGSSGQAE